MVLKANDRVPLAPCHDEFRGPRSDYVRQKRECHLRCCPRHLTRVQIYEAKSPRVDEQCDVNIDSVSRTVDNIRNNSIQAATRTGLGDRGQEYRDLDIIHINYA
ncbi:hypothetical protein TNCV_2532811 [Trichonephila clavipes]|nr:hypothetical protein TNCV_2532811 [Trichonephila clavipes]